MLHRLKGGGFRLRLKAGSVRLRRTQVTLKSPSGSGGVWFLMYSPITSSVTLSLPTPNSVSPADADPSGACARFSPMPPKGVGFPDPLSGTLNPSPEGKPEGKKERAATGKVFMPEDKTDTRPYSYAAESL